MENPLLPVKCPYKPAFLLHLSKQRIAKQKLKQHTHTHTHTFLKEISSISWHILLVMWYKNTVVKIFRGYLNSLDACGPLSF